MWFSSNSFHSLSHWLASELEKSIIKHYLAKEEGSNKIEQLQKYMVENNAPEEHLKQLALTLQEYSTLEQQELKKYEEGLRVELETKLLDLVEPKKPKKKRKNKKDKKKKEEE